MNDLIAKLKAQFPSHSYYTWSGNCISMLSDTAEIDATEVIKWLQTYFGEVNFKVTIGFNSYSFKTYIFIYTSGIDSRKFDEWIKPIKSRKGMRAARAFKQS